MDVFVWTLKIIVLSGHYIKNIGVKWDLRTLSNFYGGRIRVSEQRVEEACGERDRWVKNDDW